MYVRTGILVFTNIRIYRYISIYKHTYICMYIYTHSHAHLFTGKLQTDIKWTPGDDKPNAPFSKVRDTHTKDNVFSVSRKAAHVYCPN